MSVFSLPCHCTLPAAALVFLSAGSAHAVELVYKWKAGDQHRFQYEEKTQFALSGMMGMAMTPTPGGDAAMTATVRSAFSEKVLKARPDGSADILLTIDTLSIEQAVFLS